MIPRSVVKGLGTASLMAIMVGISGAAEAADKTFRVPFAFTVKDKTFPPGTYHVSAAEGPLLVRGPHDGVLVLTQPLTPLAEAQGQLVFHKYGNEYFLEQAWLGGGSGHEVITPRDARDPINARRDRRALDFVLVTIPAL